jgi:hypothetical protein
MTDLEISEATGERTWSNLADEDDMTVVFPDACRHERVRRESTGHRRICRDCGLVLRGSLFGRAQARRIEREVDLGYAESEDPVSVGREADEEAWKWQK